MLDPSEQLPHLAEDSFDPVLRDRLVEFFGRALHRDAARRFGSLKEMTRAWTDVFRDLDEAPPLTTRHTITLDDSAEPDEARDAAAKAATADTPLAAAGLTARALSIAQQQLGVTTVGELLRVQPKRIMQLRGIGIIPRNELVRRAGQWRRQLGLTEIAGITEKTSDTERSSGQPSRTATPPGADGTSEVPVTGSLDEVARQLIPGAGTRRRRDRGHAVDPRPAGCPGSSVARPALGGPAGHRAHDRAQPGRGLRPAVPASRALGQVGPGRDRCPRGRGGHPRRARPGARRQPDRRRAAHAPRFGPGGPLGPAQPGRRLRARRDRHRNPAGAPPAGRAAPGRPRARRPHPLRRSRRSRGGRPDRLRAPARRTSRRARLPRPAAQRDGDARRTAGHPSPRGRRCPTPTWSPWPPRRRRTPR